MAVIVRGLLLLGLALAVTSKGTTTTIGKNSLTCITFDQEKIMKTKNFDGEVQKDCGLNGNCGLYKRPLRVAIPAFQKEEFLDLSVSVWFKRQGGDGCWPVFANEGDCERGTIQINSMDDTHLMVTVKHLSGRKYQQIFITESQSCGWHHVVVTVQLIKYPVAKMEWIKVYIDGYKKSRLSRVFDVGKLRRVSPESSVKSECAPRSSGFYNGLVDSISVANYVVTLREVQKLYKSHGMCIGVASLFQSFYCGKTWALIVAGSKGYGNYRHQADACHAYRIMRNRGIPKERIVLMIYDDIANHPSNPDPGKIFNRPNGPNVYDVIVDYSGNDVTASNFLNILKGNQVGMAGIGSGKVINSGPYDNVFVFYTNHGGPNILAFPSGPYLTATSLNNAIVQMHAGNQYNKMVFYIEACYSGSMFNTLLPNNIDVYATTASSPTESSYAHYYSSQHGAYLGDEYSINWMEDSDVKDLHTESIHEQYLIVRAKTLNSHVHEYGHHSISYYPVAHFQSWKGCGCGGWCPFWWCCWWYCCAIPVPIKLIDTLQIDWKIHEDLQDSVAAENVSLSVLQRKLAVTSEEPVRARIQGEIKAIEQTREAVVGVFSGIVQYVTGDDEEKTKRILSAKHEISNSKCYEAATKLFNEICFSFTQNQFALLQLQTLVNLCEEGIKTETVLRSISAVCHTDMDRSPFKDMAD